MITLVICMKLKPDVPVSGDLGSACVGGLIHDGARGMDIWFLTDKHQH